VYDIKNEKKSRLKLLNETLLAKRRFGGQRRHYQATNCLKVEKKKQIIQTAE
jgi:hypothetical protein